MKPPLEFLTGDGFVLMYDDETNEWTDGELAYGAREGDLWPLDSEKEPLDGAFISAGPPPDLLPRSGQ